MASPCEAVGAVGLGRPPQVLLVGVTPELWRLSWPVGTRLRAVDRSVEMIGAVWPRDGLPEGASAEVGGWSCPIGQRWRGDSSGTST